MARTLRRDAACAAASLLLGVAGCGPSSPATAAASGNTLLITLCGVRADLLEQVAAEGDAPALAKLRASAPSSVTFASAGHDCATLHYAILLAAVHRAPPMSSAVFHSRSDLFGIGVAAGCATESGPLLERFGYDIDGPDAVPTTLQRDANATADAAIAWLAHATTPFFLLVQLDPKSTGSAVHTATDAERGTEARAALRALDVAVGKLIAELSRAGRHRRTEVIVAIDNDAANAARPGSPESGRARPLPQLWTEPPEPLVICGIPSFEFANLENERSPAPRLDPRAATLAARGEDGSKLDTVQRLAKADEACRVAPWYFPAFRAAAALRQQRGDVAGALAVLDRYAQTAPLSPEARAAFNKLHASTRARLVSELPREARAH
ncbi:MAG: hypothetical protein EXS13_01145 [Planctomycetes bacterium]|nr:hypothetical protein [Planctomycetota bacterium]